MSDPVAVLAVLVATVAAAEWLGSRGQGRRLGPAIIVIGLGAVVGNSGVVPSASTSTPVYDAIFTVVAPISIFLLLLDVRLGALRRAGLPMLLAFGLGALGTMCGALAARYVTDVRAALGDRAGPLSGMFTGTYIGGSANFNAIALHYEVVDDSVVFVGATAVDAILGTLFIIVILGLPGLLYRLGFEKAESPEGDRLAGDAKPSAPAHAPAEAALSVWGLCVTLTLALASLHLSNRIAEASADAGLEIPSILVLTSLALVVAQTPWVRALGSARTLGQFAIYLFLAVIGVHCELATVGELGELAPTLILFVLIVLGVHTLVLVGGGWLLKLEPEIIAMGSNANVMGAATAPAVAESIGRHDLVLPGILAGSLGTALGTYLGFLVAAL